jgi:hypothetical protein
MRFVPDSTDSTFHDWLAASPGEDDLREAYLTLEAKRADLWTPGHIDSFRRDRYDLDARYIRHLVQIKKALASHWIVTGQVDDVAAEPTAV